MAPKWRLCSLLFRSVLAPMMQKEMGLDNVALGWIFSAFCYAYTSFTMVSGLTLDRVNLRWAFGAAVLAWPVVSALTGLAGWFVRVEANEGRALV